jgi:hypothetical protein
MGSCLAVYLDLLGTCILTDGVTHDSRSTLMTEVYLVCCQISGFHVLVTLRRDNTDSTFCPKIALGEFHPLPNQRLREGRE